MSSQNKMHPNCVIFGGGGHAAVVIDTLQSAGFGERSIVLDPDPGRWGQSILGVPVIGNDDLLPELVAAGVTTFAVGLGSTGDNSHRRKLFELGQSFKLEPLTIIHPSAVYSQSAVLGNGAQLLPGSILNARAKLGVNVILNTGAIVEHDCAIGDHVHIATGAHLAGSVDVGQGGHIGAGATIKQSIVIGDRAIVGAGSVVVADVEPDTVVIGVPAKPIVIDSET